VFESAEMLSQHALSTLQPVIIFRQLIVFNTKLDQNEKTNKETELKQKNYFKSQCFGNGKEHRGLWTDKGQYMCFHLW